MLTINHLEIKFVFRKYLYCIVIITMYARAYGRFVFYLKMFFARHNEVRNIALCGPNTFFFNEFARVLLLEVKDAVDEGGSQLKRASAAE